MQVYIRKNSESECEGESMGTKTGGGKNPGKRSKTTKAGMAAVLLCVLHILILIGCGSEPEEQGETTEVFGIYTISPSGVLRADGSGYLHFYDPESEKAAYLCSHAGCLHQDSQCSAYMEGLAGAFFAQDKLYFLKNGSDGTQLVRANRYGEDRTTIGTLEGILMKEYTKQAEGKLYFVCIVYDEEERINTYRCYEFDPEQDKVTQLELPDSGMRISSLADMDVTEAYYYYVIAGSDVKLSDYFDQESANFNEIDWDEITYTYQLIRVERDTGKAEPLIKQEVQAAEMFAAQILQAEGDELLLFWGNQIVSTDSAGEIKAVLYERGESWSVDAMGDYYIVSDYSSGDNVFYLLKDWQEVGSFTGPDGITYLGASGGTVYFMGANKLYYMDYEEVEAGNYELKETEF